MIVIAVAVVGIPGGDLLSFETNPSSPLFLRYTVYSTVDHTSRRVWLHVRVHAKTPRSAFQRPGQAFPPADAKRALQCAERKRREKEIKAEGNSRRI